MGLLCTIGMRGGSKGVPNKNMRLLHGKPLMAYTIEQAKESGLFEHIVVSTDSEQIAEIARTHGAEAWFLRPPELATDEAAKLPAIRHVLLESEKQYNKKFEVICDLDVTSPLRFAIDITNAYEQFKTENADILISAAPSRKNPYFNMVEVTDGRVKLVKDNENDNPIRRQDAPKVYDMNASIYFYQRNALLTCKTLITDKTSLYVMPEDRSIDIDSELDFEFVDFIMGKRNGNN